MTLSQAHLEWKQTTQSEAIQQARQQTIENFLKARFGVLDEQLAAIVQPFAKLPAQAYSALLLQPATLSREALLAKFNLPEDESLS